MAPQSSSQPNGVVLETQIAGLNLLARGKVRDVYEDPKDPSRLLIVATDRISAFDYILPTGIPEKGRVLTQLTLFWLELLKDVVPNHYLGSDVPSGMEGRAMWVKRCDMFAVECVVRGYLVGSGWKDYQKTGAVCGIKLPEGLKESDQLPEPIYTPSTKATSGHDENISFEETVKLVGQENATKLRDLTIAVYKTAANYAKSKGIIIADTKLEFGVVDGVITLADEVLTPDSSRFWPADQYAPGKSQPSFDKQYVRDYLESVKWNKQPPAPPLPEDVAAKTSEKYLEAYKLITGKDLGAK